MSELYTTHGNVRGGCGHRHKSIMAALKCVRADRRARGRVGGYSDRRVVRVDDESRLGFVDLDDDERAERDACIFDLGGAV